MTDEFKSFKTHQGPTYNYDDEPLIKRYEDLKFNLQLKNEWIQSLEGQNQYLKNKIDEYEAEKDKELMKFVREQIPVTASPGFRSELRKMLTAFKEKYYTNLDKI
jgi:hypothetical protein